MSRREWIDVSLGLIVFAGLFAMMVASRDWSDPCDELAAETEIKKMTDGTSVEVRRCIGHD